MGRRFQKPPIYYFTRIWGEERVWVNKSFSLAHKLALQAQRLLGKKTGEGCSVEAGSAVGAVSRKRAIKEVLISAHNETGPCEEVGQSRGICVAMAENGSLKRCGPRLQDWLNNGFWRITESIVNLQVKRNTARGFGSRMCINEGMWCYRLNADRVFRRFLPRDEEVFCVAVFGCWSWLLTRVELFAIGKVNVAVLVNEALAGKAERSQDTPGLFCVAGVFRLTESRLCSCLSRWKHFEVKQDEGAY